MEVKTPIKRGDVVRVVFDPVRGHEQAGVRPALVLSPNVINDHYSTVMVAAITSAPRVDDVPLEVRMAASQGGLTKDSRILLLQTRCIDKSSIIGKYGHVSDDTMKQVDRAVAIVTGLMKL